MRLYICMLLALTGSAAILAAQQIALIMPDGSPTPAAQTDVASSALPSYHQLKQIAVGGDGMWDYLTFDSAAQRLYISRSTHVMVVDAGKGAVVGEVANTPGVHGIALAPKLHRGFTSNGGENTVTVFDMKTLKELARVSVGTHPDCIVYDPASRRVFTMNAGSDDATAIDAASMKAVGTIPLGGRPEFAAVDAKGGLFVNIVDKNELVAIDAKALSVKNRWSLAPGEHPSGLAIDAKHRRLFSVCSNNVMIVMDADSGRVVATPAIGKGPDAAAFDPNTGLALSSNGRDGTLTVIHEDSPQTFTVQATVPTQAGARTMALDLKSHNVYLATARFQAPPTPPAGNTTPAAAITPSEPASPGGTAAPAVAVTPRRMPAIEPNSFVILVFQIDQPRPPQQNPGVGRHRHGMG